MAGLNDFAGYADQLDRELGKVTEEFYAEEDLSYVKRFIQKCDKEVKASTLGTYLQNLRTTAGRLDQPICTLSEADFEEHVYDISHNPAYGRNGDGLADDTVRTFEFVVRRFHRILDTPTSDWAEDYDLTQQVDSSVHEDDMLRSEDIAKLRDGALNLRDVAMIEFFADTGARRSLVGSLRVGDVDLDGELPTYTPNRNAIGLKDAVITRYPIIDSAATLRNYLRTTHPRPERDDVALFHKLPGHGNGEFGEDDPGGVTATSQWKQLRAAADRAGIEKPVNPHNFRHSAITRMAREGYTRSQIEHRVHWNIDTDEWETYEHIAAEEHNEDIFRAAGILEADGSEHSQQRHPCGNCHEPLAPHHEYCPRCGESASPESRERKRQAISAIAQALRGMDDDERSEFLADSVGELESDPSLMGHHESPSPK